MPEPRPPRLIARGEALAALDRAAARKVTVISAPAGSGKTSLLRAWASRLERGQRIAFVSVRRDQEDAQEFWLALLNAVRHTEPLTVAPDLNVGGARPGRGRPAGTAVRADRRPGVAGEPAAA